MNLTPRPHFSLQICQPSPVAATDPIVAPGLGEGPGRGHRGLISPQSQIGHGGDLSLIQKETYREHMICVCVYRGEYLLPSPSSQL